MSAEATGPRIVILGGGFGGVYAAFGLERAAGRGRGASRAPGTPRVTLVSRDNFYVVTPLLFEAASGVLEARHAVSPIRLLLKRTAFVEAEIEGVDFDRREVRVCHAPGEAARTLPYDHLVLALGGVSQTGIVPGAEEALTFKTLADAIYLRNHVIDAFERAEIETDAARRRELLSFVVVGGGLVGVELMGELTVFVENLTRVYPGLAGTPAFHLVDAGPRILGEMDEKQADYAAGVLRRRGVEIITQTRVKRAHGDRVELEGGRDIPTRTIILATGVAANPLLKDFPLAKHRSGRISVEPTLRSKERPEVWALGDCAAIPDPSGNPYPTLAQHALREARVLSSNLLEVVRRGPDAPLQPFVYESLGMLAALGHHHGVGRLLRLKIRGFFAWWVWRTYYLWQMPGLGRKLRIVADWTLALFFRVDVVKLDLFGEEHAARLRERRKALGPGPAAEADAPSASA